MFAQKLKSSCKMISVSFGFVSSYFAYQYQQTFGVKVDQKMNENLDILQGWVKWRSKLAYNTTESLLLQYCQWISMSPLFHKMDMTSVLIFLAENQNTMFLHDLCIKLLAVVQFPQDMDMEYYLKKCDYTTLIGLARSNGVDLKWFEQQKDIYIPSSIPHDHATQLKFRIESVLRDIRNSLPDNGKHDCSTWLFDKVFNEHFPKDPVTNIMVDLSVERDNHYNLTEEVEVPFQQNLSHYLKILRRYSTNETITSDQALCARVLEIMKEVIILCHDEKGVLEKCGNIVANLACNNENRRAIVQKKYLSLLMNWKLSKDTTLQIIADRVLCNLDAVQCDNGMVRLCEGIYVLHPNCRSESEALIDVVFVHGIRGSPFYTWRQENSPDKELLTKCWPKDWLPVDYPNIRVICVHYDSAFSEWFSSCPNEKNKRTVDNQAEMIKKKLELCGVGDRPIVWVSHSLGGLITKKLLSFSSQEKDPKILSSTKGLVFYSVPHLGAPMATRVLYPSTEVKELILNSEKLKSLHDEFLKIRKEYNLDCLDFAESRPINIPYFKYGPIIVPQNSSNVGYGRFMLLDTDHLDVCKPSSKVDPRYWEVSAMIRKVLKEHPTTEDMFNNALL